jgi:hypothetical protein
VAATGDQVAYWDEERKHGLFTSLFLRAVAGEADGQEYGNRDGRVSGAELKGYLEEQVRFTARRRFRLDQTPTLEGLELIDWRSLNVSSPMNYNSPAVREVQKKTLDQEPLDEGESLIARVKSWSVISFTGWGHICYIRTVGMQESIRNVIEGVKLYIDGSDLRFKLPFEASKEEDFSSVSIHVGGEIFDGFINSTAIYTHAQTNEKLMFEKIKSSKSLRIILSIKGGAYADFNIEGFMEAIGRAADKCPEIKKRLRRAGITK